MNLRKTRNLCVEVYQTLNNLNPEFIIAYNKIVNFVKLL